MEILRKADFLKCDLMQKMLDIHHLRKSFGTTTVLHDITFTLEAHQTLAVLGRSGCGKTTLLKIIAGLLDGEGAIHLHGADITNQSPQQRGVVYLYQEALLFPHLDVFENIAFGLRLRRESAANVRERTGQMLENLDLTAHIHKMPTELSGGQKQRVAFGRALIIQPKLLLLDEPFGALDVETRTNMQGVFKRIAAAQGITAIFVTHDLKEAVLMGDRLGYMHNGQLEIYPNQAAFVQDERTGMQQEIVFWKNIV